MSGRALMQMRNSLPAEASVRMVRALGKRDLRRYFSNPTGYVFITLFILLSAAAAFWRPRFFLNGLANLDQLNDAFPYLLLFFVPALTMALWSEEQRHGTDELLLTMPAGEQAIVLGKYAAAVGIYTVSVLVALSHVVVLAWLGSPDPGLMAANYLGFWFMGIALIPVGMLASLLIGNTTIAFIVGALLCAIPVGLGRAASTVGTGLGRALDPLTVFPYFSDFARGIVSLEAVLYFVSLPAVFLFVNVLLLRRRHRPYASSQGVHWIARTAALSVVLACVIVLSGRTGARLDLTAERLSTLSAQTQALLDAMPADRLVLIQAFVSADTPRPLVETRENLLNLLREIEATHRDQVTVSIQDTAPYSASAALARERFNILPRAVSDPATGEVVEDLYLGVAVTSGIEEQVIPFFDPGLSPEYEIARAIRVVSRGSRKRLGIIDTDVKMLGGVDFDTSQPRPVWAAVQELRKQYDVVEVTPASAADADVDVLVVVLPSRMTQTDLDLALDPVTRGIPTLMLLDPLPAMNIELAPGADLALDVDPFRERGPTRIIFGDIRSALARFNINWVPALIAWDAFNPHPDLSDLPRETVFVAPGNGNPDAINRQNPATAALQELLLLYPGYLLGMNGPGFTMEPLLQTGTVSGAASFFDLVRPVPGGLILNPSPPREPSGRQYVMAARVRSADPLVEAPGARPVDLVAIADVDFISDAFFDIRATAGPTARFDNITFFVNTIDLLAGDHTYIALRNRRARYRTLERLEAQTRTFMERRAREEQQAQRDAQSALEAARARLRRRLEELNARTDLDLVAKQMMARNLEEVENRQLRVLERTIVQARDARVRASRDTMEAQIRRIRTRIRLFAVVLPPLPILAVGIGVFIRRARRERESARATGRLRTVEA